MIRTYSTASSSTSYSSNEHHSPTSPLHTSRFTLQSFVTRLSDSKNNLMEQIPSQQRRLTRFKKRARSFLSSTFNDYSFERRSASCDRRKSSEGIISVDEIYRRFNATHPNDPHMFNLGIPIPKLLQPSALLNAEHTQKILIELPARLHSMDWCMVFSTEAHGFSLSQLYRRSLEFDSDMPVLVVVKDVEQNIFGAFVPHQLIVKDGVYGTGESFLFTLFPEFRVFNWSGGNEFFVKGDLNSIGFGVGEGTYGLWFDADLYHGRTCPCKTFNNDCLSSNEDFIIASIEVWTFTD
ncbi:unnamed protein product [Adineta ricciae]|uniref:Oxidation resistance protein 1 n=1 Tax=Adineta ricciae TaxID=249248 RepID=A0A814CJJ6_ADIRI|nr:unnamed protein product [Adineta ricciae]